MAPVMQYVFAEMLVISEYFAAGSHEWLPYSKNVVRTKSSNTNLSLIFLFYHTFRNRARDWGKGKIAVDFRGGIEYDKHKEMGPCPYI